MPRRSHSTAMATGLTSPPAKVPALLAIQVVPGAEFHATIRENAKQPCLAAQGVNPA